VNAESIRKLFEQVRGGTLTPDDAVDRLRHLPFEDLALPKLTIIAACAQACPK